MVARGLNVAQGLGDSFGGTKFPFRPESRNWQRGSQDAPAKLELMGRTMGFSVDASESRMNAGDSEDTASAKPIAERQSECRLE